MKQLTYILTGAIFLMLDSFYNGFPIVYSDTSTYLASGFELETPFDRPITYGLFLRIASLNGLSMWLVIFFQALILSYLIFLLAKAVLGDKHFLKYSLTIIATLSLFTSISWTVCQVMPDIFTAIAFLCMTLLLLEKHTKKTQVLLYFIFFLSIAMHISHFLIFLLLLLILFTLKRYIFPTKDFFNTKKHFALLFILSAISIVTMGSALSKSKHIFFMGAMVEHGIAKKYLDDQCENKNYKLCTYKDSLPSRAYEFVWDEKSPVYKIGSWKESKKEFNEIIYNTLTEPKYIKMHVVESAKATFDQLTKFGIGEGNGSFLEGTLLHERISKYFSSDLKHYACSKQSESKLSGLEKFNLISYFVVVLSILFIMIVFLSDEIFLPVRSKLFYLSSVLEY